MEEKPNVNNLNGVPNFGHGFPEAGVDVEALEVSEDTKEPEVEITSEEE